MTNKEKAYLYFWPELGGKCKEGWCLHHKDPSWRKEDPERYKQWNIEDLVPMTNEEHSRFHMSGENNNMYGKHFSEETKEKMRQKAVRCVETNEVFKSQSEAARHFNVSKTMIGYSINRHLFIKNKYHFEYVVKRKDETKIETETFTVVLHLGK